MNPDPQPRFNDFMRPLGDRRGRIRLEVVGSLWGTLEVAKPARVVNISRTGALIASPVPAALNSTQRITLVVYGQEISVDARVRHVQRVTSTGADGASYRIGLEFLEVPVSLAVE
jgi:PilZ domain